MVNSSENKEAKLVQLINRAKNLTKAYAVLTPNTLRPERLLEILLETLRDGASQQRKDVIAGRAF